MAKNNGTKNINTSPSIQDLPVTPTNAPLCCGIVFTDGDKTCQMCPTRERCQREYVVKTPLGPDAIRAWIKTLPYTVPPNPKGFVTLSCVRDFLVGAYKHPDRSIGSSTSTSSTTSRRKYETVADNVNEALKGCKDINAMIKVAHKEFNVPKKDLEKYQGSALNLGLARMQVGNKIRGFLKNPDAGKPKAVPKTAKK